jgi:hypothetical protein
MTIAGELTTGLLDTRVMKRADQIGEPRPVRDKCVFRLSAAGEGEAVS